MAATQIGHPLRVKSPLGDDALLLESFEGEERISTPFRFVLKVLAEDANVDLKGLLRQPMVISIKLSGKKERHIHGNVRRAKLLEAGEDGLAAYEVEIVPWFWFLHLFTDCRIFQNKTVPQIIEKVFKDRGFTDFRLDLQETYPPREYCVQYRETDFNFVSRLMEQEGIYYYFEQTEEKHTMMLVDNSAMLRPCPHQAEAKYLGSGGGNPEENTVTQFEQELTVHTGTASSRDYDFTKPTAGLSATVSGDQAGEYYDYPGLYTTQDDGGRYARIRLEEREIHLNTGRGVTNCMGLECGYKFTLKDYIRESANVEYVLLAISHKAKNTSYRSNDDTALEYTNRVEGFPATAPFRPPMLARKPVIDGAQTAVVAGKSGEEIWTDQYGRVTVQFFWDREGKNDEHSSCWVRVAQSWAGKLWGSIYTPRIGQEVIVTFLEGDPDRPIITGRVYNAEQMPPYPLPGQQTKSTVKSLSSKGGGGFNELRFEDLKGSEQVFLHGEKNLDVRIKHDRMEWIGNNRSLVVGNDKLEKIGKDEHNHVVGKRVELVEGDHLLEIKGKEGIKITGAHALSVQGDVTETFKGNHSLEVGENIYIKGMQIVIEATTGLTLNVGGNFITIDASGVSVKGTLILLNSGGAKLPGSVCDPVPVDPPTDPTQADTADPGAVGSPGASVTATPKNIVLQTVSPAKPPQEQEDEPERSAPTASPGGGKSAQPADTATFPKDVDKVALATTLENAAKDGVPFCEECQKAAPAPSGPPQQGNNQ